MIYIGSKNRIAKEIIPIITKGTTKDTVFVELFCGGCNLTDKLNFNNIIANDYNKYLIALFKRLVENKLEFIRVTKEEYQSVKYNKSNYEDWFVGYVGFICSFKGKFFDGFNGNYTSRDYQTELFNNLLKQKDLLKNVTFSCCDYKDVIIPNESVIYCDPPYVERKYYSSIETQENFDISEFYDYCRKLSKTNKVFISCYNPPADAVILWSKNINCDLSKNHEVEETQIKTEYLITFNEIKVVKPKSLF